MGTPFTPLSFLEDPENPQSRFLNLFNNFSSQFAPEENFFNPNDPDYIKYRELSSSPPQSESLISDYVNKAPTHEKYDPSVKRRMLAVLLGTLSGPSNARRVAEDFVTSPYRKAVEDWKMEGSNIATRGRLMDADRQRQLNALKFSLQGKTAAEKDRANREFKRDQENRRLAAEIAAEEDRAASRQQRQTSMDALEEQRKFNNHLATIASGLAQERFKESKRRADEVAAAKATDLDKTNKRLSAFASQQGIDTTGKTALEVAVRLSAQKLAAKPEFSEYIKIDPNAPGGYIILNANGEPEEPGQGMEPLIKRNIQGLSKIFLAGRGY